MKYQERVCRTWNVTSAIRRDGQQHEENESVQYEERVYSTARFTSAVPREALQYQESQIHSTRRGLQ